jgi:hypothetical protein
MFTYSNWRNEFAACGDSHVLRELVYLIQFDEEVSGLNSAAPQGGAGVADIRRLTLSKAVFHGASLVALFEEGDRRVRPFTVKNCRRYGHRGNGC